MINVTSVCLQLAQPYMSAEADSPKLAAFNPSAALSDFSAETRLAPDAAAPADAVYELDFHPLLDILPFPLLLGHAAS